MAFRILGPVEVTVGPEISISALRRLFTSKGHAATISTREQGYVLEIGAGQLDSQRFDALVAAARAARDAGQAGLAVANCRDALRLWRGHELGIEPGERLRRLEQAILTCDPALESPAEPVCGTPGRSRLGRHAGRGDQPIASRRGDRADWGRTGGTRRRLRTGACPVVPDPSGHCWGALACRLRG